MNLSKQLLRSRLGTGRKAMSTQEVETKSRAITQKLLSEVNWAQIKNVHIYKSVPEWKEVDTNLLVSEIKNQNPVITLVQPSTKANDPLPSQIFDVIIVPVLGFDKNNYRLGLGAGWYDRFLAAQRSAVKIGLCFQAGFLSDGFPVESHDERLDKIITEV